MCLRGVKAKAPLVVIGGRGNQGAEMLAAKPQWLNGLNPETCWLPAV